jgi:hypothetical protein
MNSLAAPAPNLYTNVLMLVLVSSFVLAGRVMQGLAVLIRQIPGERLRDAIIFQPPEEEEEEEEEEEQKEEAKEPVAGRGVHCSKVGCELNPF